MALNFDLSEIENYETLCWTETEMGRQTLAPVTEALSFLTISVGIHQITEKNAEEFYDRVTQVEKKRGVTLNSVTEDNELQPRPITLDDVLAHVGLRTNASPMTKTQFGKTLA